MNFVYGTDFVMSFNLCLSSSQHRLFLTFAETVGFNAKYSRLFRTLAQLSQRVQTDQHSIAESRLHRMADNGKNVEEATREALVSLLSNVRLNPAYHVTISHFSTQ